MRDFQIIRYLRKALWFIAVLALLAGVLFYMYLSSRQTYRAQTMIEFLNEEAEEGLYPTGDKIDVNEITSSTVIASAIQKLNRYDMTDNVRSQTSITAIIPDDIQAIRQSAWEMGKDYEYFPTSYIITVTSKESADYARQLLEAIIDSYIDLYAEKYISITKVTNSAKSLQNLDYDYIEYAEVLNSFVKDEMSFLSRAVYLWPNFRASSTGFSFADLQNEFSLIQTVYIPELYKSILNEHITKDAETLISRYQYQIHLDEIKLENDKEHLEKILEVIETYAKKNRDNMDFHWSVSEDYEGGNAADNDATVAGSRYVLGSVYDYGGAGRYQETTYDAVLGDYITVSSEIAGLERDIEYCNYILSFFNSSRAESTSEQRNRADYLLTAMENRLRELDELLIKTAAEQSETETVKNVTIRSTVNVSQTMNMRMYTVVVVVVFFMVGCVGSIVVGRVLDILDYKFYVDPLTKLPNRAKCDMEISRYDETALPMPFSCIVVAIDNLNEINSTLGRENGNEVMRIFANYLKECNQNLGFVGYNGGMQFLCLFPKCDEQMALYYQNLVERLVGEFNDAGYGVQIRYKIVYSCLSPENPCTMRELLGQTMRKIRGATAVTPGKVQENQQTNAPAAGKEGEKQ